MCTQHNQPIEGFKLDYPRIAIHSLFEKSALLFSTSVAIKHRDRQLTYGNLRDDVNQMAHYLLSEGVQTGSVVAVSIDRSPNLIITLLAILQCGATYVPIDSNFPKARIAFMLEDSKCSYLITNEHLLPSFPKDTNILVIENIIDLLDKYPKTPISTLVSSETTAYILYTSGSTGKPKGVTVTHKNLVNFLSSMAIEPGIDKTDRVLSITTISFDISGLEFYLPLLHGATLVIADDTTVRDGRLLLELLKKEKITILQATPTSWQMLLDSEWENPLPLKALCGGEPMPLKLAHKLISLCDTLWNMYGPTETTIWSTTKQIHADDDLISIGKPIANTQIYILSEEGKPVADGEIGEIVIGGDGVAQGYWNRPVLTAEKFITNHSLNTKDTLYLTGDLGKLLPNQDIQCLGRKDHQVKIRGYRIELGEIESALNSLHNVKNSAVIVNSTLGKEPRLVAYLISNSHQQETAIIKNQLKDLLPDYFLPSMYIWVKEFPITPNGKIDKNNLPLPEYVRPDSAPVFNKPRTSLEKNIADIWNEELEIPSIGIDDDFFDMGGTSILAQKVSTLMKLRLSLEVSVSNIYIYPTIAKLAKFLGNDINKEESFVLNKSKKPSSDIAIIGMAGRFPGANSIEDLWEILRDGKETITFFTKEEVDVSIPESLRNDPLYITARGLLPSAKTFDASFFGLNQQVAAAMDPQIRVFLELCWEALEQTGHLPKHFKGSIGVYAGSEFNTYYEKNILPNKEINDQIGYWQTYTVNAKDFIAPRVAFHLNLQGPAVSVHSACSTSLLAVAEAVKAIRTGMCDVALAGGSSVNSPIYSGHLYDDGFIKSPNGSTRPFDASGKGTVFSDGAGVVLLKSLEAAQKDGDIIYGLIKGVGVNNDGGEKGSFMAPSAKGQAGSIINALNDAQISPSTISYLEAHGTATPVGDPIEIEGLKMAYGKQEKNCYCALGSIKSNFGHTTAAAGVAGLIKTVLSLYHKQIPPMVGYNKPNPAIDFENSPFYINNKLIDWNSDGPRRAGVSSFGVGSTNVHVILEEYETNHISHDSKRPFQLLTWSAKNQNSLTGYENLLGNFLDKSQNIPLSSVAYSLHTTREDFNHRSFLIANNTTEAAKNLNTTKNSKSSVLKVAPNEIGFLFPGQGAQYLQMGKTLYDTEKIYQDAVDTCAELLNEHLKLDIREIIYPKNSSDEAEQLLKDTRLTQPALFVTEYALSQLWISWGIKPTFLCGHSIGEFVAAHLAGVFNLEDALYIVATRGRLISELPGGSMLAIRTSLEDLQEILPKTISIAAINSKQFCVVAGTYQDIEEFSKIIESKDIPHKILATSHAFHSFMMDPILDIFKNELEKIKLNVPRLPIISTATGTWLTDHEATSPSYWVNHLKNTVRFADAMDTAFELEDFILLEVGPGQSLTTLARQQASGKIISAFTSLTFPKDENENEYSFLLNTLGELWLKGIKPDWNSFYDKQQTQKINLPSYVYDRKPCWVDPITTSVPTRNPETTIQNPVKVPEIIENIVIKDDETNKVTALLSKVLEIMTQASGITYDLDSVSNTFIELGLDSLSLTQLSGRLKKEFVLPITFRQLNQEFSTPLLLAEYLSRNLPEQETVELPKEKMILQQNINNSLPTDHGTQVISNQNQISMEQIVQQLKLLNDKIEALQKQHISFNGNNKILSKEKALTNHNNIVNSIHETYLPKKNYIINSDNPPIPGAKLGRDNEGNPAWFIADPNQESGYIKINL